MAATLTFPKVDRTSFNFSWKFCVTFTISSFSASLNFTIEAAINFIFPAHKFMLNLCECKKGKCKSLKCLDSSKLPQNSSHLKPHGSSVSCLD